MDGLVFLQLMLRSKRSLGRASRIPPRKGFFWAWRPSWPHVGPIFRSWAALGRFLDACYVFFTIFCNFLRFRTDFGWFGDYFGRVWGGILPWFLTFEPKMTILWKIAFYLRKTTIFKESRHKQTTKKRRFIDKKSMPIWNGKTKANKSPKNRIWRGLGLHLGGLWDFLGRLLGALGCLLAVLGAFKIELFSSMGPRWAPRGLLDRFWEGLGRVLGGVREIFEGFGQTLGAPLGNYYLISCAYCVCLLLHHIFLQEPPRCLATPRGASQFFFNIWPNRNSDNKSRR